MKALAFAVALLVPGIAHAGVEITRGDDAVIIHVDGGAVGGPVIGGVDHLDVPLVHGAETAQNVRIPDHLVRKVELGDGKVRIKLRTNRRKTRAIAAAVQVRVVGDDLEIVIPRHPEQVVIVPEPPAAAPVEPEAEPVIDAEPAPSPAPQALTTGTEAPVVDAPAPEPITGAPSSPKPVTGAASSKVPWTSILLVLGLVSAAALMLRRRRARAVGSSISPLTIRTSLNVGPKARVHLLAAGDRELLVAVDPRGVRLLDAWTREPEHEDGPIVDPPAARALRRTDPRPSPVAGLMQLRRRTATDAPSDAAGVLDEDGPPDDAWARELMTSLERSRS